MTHEPVHETTRIQVNPWVTKPVLLYVLFLFKRHYDCKQEIIHDIFHVQGVVYPSGYAFSKVSIKKSNQPELCEEHFRLDDTYLF